MSTSNTPGKTAMAPTARTYAAVLAASLSPSPSTKVTKKARIETAVTGTVAFATAGSPLKDGAQKRTEQAAQPAESQIVMDLTNSDDEAGPVKTAPVPKAVAKARTISAMLMSAARGKLVAGCRNNVIINWKALSVLGGLVSTCASLAFSLSPLRRWHSHCGAHRQGRKDRRARCQERRARGRARCQERRARCQERRARSRACCQERRARCRDQRHTPCQARHRKGVARGRRRWPWVVDSCYPANC